MTVADSVLTIPAGWYSDPLGRFPLRYWDGGAWSPYGWNGVMLHDPYGTEPTPPWTVRLRGAFRFSRTSLAITVAILVGCGVATFLGASPSQLSGDLAVWLFVPLVFLAQVGDRVRWLGWIVVGLGGLLALLLFFVGLTMALPPTSSPGEALTYAAGGIGLIAVLVPNVRRWIARLIPIDPQRVVHTVALQLAILVLVSWFAGQASGSALDAKTYQGGGPVDIPLGELPLLVGGFVGVGIFVQRNFAETLLRLGLVRPKRLQFVAALLVAQLMALVGVGADFLSNWLTPQTANQLNQVSNALYGSFGSDILPWLLLAVSAGVAEEILFRGALQPRLGLLLTSVLFTTTHLQYGFSIVLGVILLGGLSLGLLRKYANTTTAIVCHVTYDLLAGLQFPSWWLFVAVGVQLPVLLFFVIRHRAAVKRALAEILRGRQQPQPAAPAVAGPA
jgi:membrane protease YdiL (CAAX protease family)